MGAGGGVSELNSDFPNEILCTHPWKCWRFGTLERALYIYMFMVDSNENSSRFRDWLS